MCRISFVPVCIRRCRLCVFRLSISFVPCARLCYPLPTPARVLVSLVFSRVCTSVVRFFLLLSMRSRPQESSSHASSPSPLFHMPCAGRLAPPQRIRDGTHGAKRPRTRPLSASASFAVAKVTTAARRHRPRVRRATVRNNKTRKRSKRKQRRKWGKTKKQQQRKGKRPGMRVEQGEQRSRGGMHARERETQEKPWALCMLQSGGKRCVCARDTFLR